MAEGNIVKKLFRRYITPIIYIIPKNLIAPILSVYTKYSFHQVLRKLNANLTKKVIGNKGVNLFGAIKNVTGIGQHSKLILDPLLEKKAPVCIINSSFNAYAEQNLLEENFLIKKRPIYKCNLITIGVKKFAETYHNELIHNNFFSYKYNILYNAWEWNKYPSSWVPLSNRFNEFWAMSNFVKESAEKALDIPVLWMPYCVDFPTPIKVSRDFFGLTKNKFTFLFSYDFFSNIHRKNPLAVIKAFLIAFPSNQDVELVIKVSLVHTSIAHRKELKTLRTLIGDDLRIKILDQVLSNDHMKALMNCCDAYVSLHRAEGFGLGMAESMKLGKPVIATNYSGNTDFTKPDTACLVGYNLINVKPSESIYYEKGQVWAEPYVEEAAEHMKKLYQDTDLYKKIAKSGQDFILKNYNSSIIGERFVKRLKSVGVL